jgi:hypothetical protein
MCYWTYVQLRISGGNDIFGWSGWDLGAGGIYYLGNKDLKGRHDMTKHFRFIRSALILAVAGLPRG